MFSVAPEIILQLIDLLENETNPTQFVCQATGVPVPYIQWYFNAVMINLSNRSKYNSSSKALNETVIKCTLFIINAESSDVGTYTCEAGNIIGTDQSFAVLTVNSECLLKYTYIAYSGKKQNCITHIVTFMWPHSLSSYHFIIPGH